MATKSEMSKVTIKTFVGPNTGVSTRGDKVRFAVNQPRPEVGEEVEVKTAQILGKYEAPAEVEKHEPVKVSHSEAKK